MGLHSAFSVTIKQEAGSECPTDGLLTSKSRSRREILVFSNMLCASFWRSFPFTLSEDSSLPIFSASENSDTESSWSVLSFCQHREQHRKQSRHFPVLKKYWHGFLRCQPLTLHLTEAPGVTLGEQKIWVWNMTRSLIPRPSKHFYHDQI